MTTTHAPAAIACDVPGVTALRRNYRSKANSQPVEERFYICVNGLALGLRTGGTFTNKGQWQIFTTQDGIPLGGGAWPTPVFIDHDEARIVRLVTNLSRWYEDAS